MRLTPIFVSLFTLAGCVQGQDLFTTSFDTPGYTVRGLTGQNSWYTFGSQNAGNPQIQSAVKRSGDQAVSVSGEGAAGYSLHAITYNDSGANKVVEGAIYVNLKSNGTSWNGLCLHGGVAPFPAMCLKISTAGFPFLNNSTQQSVLGAGPLALNTWHLFRLRLDFVAQTVTGFVNGTTVGTQPFPSAIRNLSIVGFGFNSVTGTNTAYFDDLSVTALPPAVVPALRSNQPLIQSFSGLAAMSSGSWMELYGTNLSSTTREWACADFKENCTQAPTSLDGVSVSINGRAAFVRYVSPTQVNVQAPDDGGATGPVQVTITNALGTSAPITINKSAQSPALLTTPAFQVGGKQYVAAFHSDNTTFAGRNGLIAGVAFRPARVGDVLIAYAVGCGATNPASAAGVVLGAPRPVAGTVRVMFGQTVAQAQAFVSALGLCQFNITVPNLPSGDIGIEVSINGTATGQNLFTTIE